MQPCSLTGHPSSADRLLGSGEKPRDNKEIFSNVDGAITDYADYRAVASSLAQDTQEFLFSKGSHKKFRLQNLSNIKNMLPRRKDGRSAKYKDPVTTNRYQPSSTNDMAANSQCFPIQGQAMF